MKGAKAESEISGPSCRVRVIDDGDYQLQTTLDLALLRYGGKLNGSQHAGDLSEFERAHEMPKYVVCELGRVAQSCTD